MSYLLRSLSRQQPLANYMATSVSTNLLSTRRLQNHAGALASRIWLHTRPSPQSTLGRYRTMSTSPPPHHKPGATPPPPHHDHRHPPPPPPPPPHGSQHRPTPPHDSPRGQDNIEYVVRFTKQKDIKKIFKNFYSLYGPLFIVSHISTSLASLGFFYTLVWFTVDPTKYLPDKVILAIGSWVSESTNIGGKFVIAYGIHKLLLPVRLGISIWLTRRLSPLVRRAFPRLYKEKP